jgi:hypothetical protein
LGTPDNPVSQSECPKPNIAYELSSGPWQLPTVTYETPGGDVLEVRNDKAVVAGADITFRQTGASAGRIGVVAYETASRSSWSITSRWLVVWECKPTLDDPRAG